MTRGFRKILIITVPLLIFWFVFCRLTQYSFQSSDMGNALQPTLETDQNTDDGTPVILTVKIEKEIGHDANFVFEEDNNLVIHNILNDTIKVEEEGGLFSLTLQPNERIKIPVSVIGEYHITVKDNSDAIIWKCKIIIGTKQN